MILHPNAKINLGLLIKGKLPNGYHLLETLMVPFPDLADTLEITETNGGACTLEVVGIDLDGDPTENLCVKAYNALKSRVNVLPGVHIRLTKKIPAGAGLGGGSSDAAATLLGLRKLFDLQLQDVQLARIAGTLGADIPFFIYNRPLLATGIGTEFEEVDIDLPFRIEIETPAIHSSTVAAYKALDHNEFDPNRDLRSLLALPPSEWKDQLPNDLEKPVFSLFPELKDIKMRFYDRGAIYAAMSGSGSAVFGLFLEE